jgi:ATP-binding cassette, subfamily B, bacterial
VSRGQGPDSSIKEGSGNVWHQVQPLVAGHRRDIAVLALLSIISGFAEAAVLAVVAQVAAKLVTGGKEIHSTLGPFSLDTSLGSLLIVAMVLAFVRLLLQLPISILPARITADVQARIRHDLFDAFNRAPWAIQSRDREGHLQEMMSTQVMQATQGALQVNVMVTALFSFGVLIASALLLNPGAALVVLFAAAALFGVLRPLTMLGHRRSQELSQAQLDYASAVGEAVRLAEETQVFGARDAQQSRIDQFIETSRDLFFRTQLVGRLVPNLYQSLIFLIIVSGLGVLYLADVNQVASLGAVVLLLVRAGTYGQQLQTAYQQVRQALPFVDRLRQTEAAYRAHDPGTRDRVLETFTTLTMSGVRYSYRSGQPILSGIDFEVSKGEAIGIVGPSGAGKSTLVQLLLQLRQADSGSYLIDGHAANRYKLDDWRRQVAYVPQQPRLIHASVVANIAYFRKLPLEAIERAARLARIAAEIAAWSDGYKTLIGPRADAVSGGQQQRICLARGLASNPRILILDEPTSALDPASEFLLQESLKSLAGEVTLFIVAHRLSTLDMCDRVMVVNNGEIEDFDTAENLRLQNEYYRKAAGVSGLSQANSERLEP